MAVAFLMFALVQRAGAAPDNKALARELYREGTRQYDLRDYPAALAAFRKAYLAYEEPAFLFNIAQCLRQIGDKGEAVQFYRTYLRKVPNAPNRKEVEAVIANLDSAISAEKEARATPPKETIEPPSGTVAPPPSAATTPPAAHVETPPPAASSAVTTAPPPARRPVYRTWWFWTSIGAVAAVGIGVGLGVGLSQSSGGFRNTIGEVGPGRALTVSF